MLKRHTQTHSVYLLSSVLCRFENKISDLLSWMKTWKMSTQALATTHPETTPDTPDLQENLKVDLQTFKTILTLNLKKNCRHELKYVLNIHFRIWRWNSKQKKPQLVKRSRREEACRTS